LVVAFAYGDLVRVPSLMEGGRTNYWSYHKKEEAMIKQLREEMNVPNLLSLYRLLSFPFVLYFALAGYETVFVVLLVINLITDILDGLIARVFHLETDFGAKLDSYADIGMYICAVVGVLVFKAADFAPHLTSLGIFIVTYILPKVVSYARFREFPAFHLYSNKIGGYLQGFFFFFLFVTGFNTAFYYVAILWGILSFIEQLLIVILEKEPLYNAKGLYWVLKDR
jgi:cardiolipin synthase